MTRQSAFGSTTSTRAQGVSYRFEEGQSQQVSLGGSKLWQFKYRYLSKEKKLSLGAFPEVSWKDARGKRDDARAMLADGRDPSQERQMAKLAARFSAENTFAVIAREFISKRDRDGVSEGTMSKAEWFLSLIVSTIGNMPVSEITAPVLLAVLRDVEASGRLETVRRLRAFVGRVIDYAIITGRRADDSNPARPLQRALTPQGFAATRPLSSRKLWVCCFALLRGMKAIHRRSAPCAFRLTSSSDRERSGL